MINLNNTYTSVDELPLVITVELFADVLNIGLNTAYEVVRSGAVKSLRVGHQIRIPKSALIAYLDEAAS